MIASQRDWDGKQGPTVLHVPRERVPAALADREVF